MTRTLVGESMELMASTLDARGLILYLVNQKPRYSIYVHLKNDFSLLTFNPDYAKFL